jgi:Zn-dependent protease
MDSGISSYLLYFLGIVLVIVTGAGGAFIYQIIGLRIQRPRVIPLARNGLPEYLLPVYEDTARQLGESGFEIHHFAHSQDVVVHEHAEKWSMVMLNRNSGVFAEIAPATTFLAMPGVEVDFWSIANDGTAFVTMNGKGHTLLGEIPGAQVHDPLKETLSSQYQAHLEQRHEFQANRKLVRPDTKTFIKIQQKLLDAYFLKLIKDKTIISTGNNLFRISFIKSLKLAGQFIKGETRVHKLARTHWSKYAGNKKSSAPATNGHAETNTQAVTENTTYTLSNSQSRYPVDAEVYAFLRLKSAHESRTTGMVSKVILFMITMVISYFAFGLAFSFNSVFILLAVILLHELGHIAAMHAFKYRDLQILFLPFLGAAATGKKENVAVWKQVVVYLMGPLPGIVLGLTLIILNKDWQAPLVYETATIMLVVNYLNLLPLVPLDGGHIVRLTIMERFPTGKLVFLGISVAAFAAGGFFLSEPVFWVLALAMLAALPMARMETAVLKILNQQNTNLDTLDVAGRLRKVFEALKMPQFNKLNFSGKYNLVKSLSEVILQQRHCSTHTAISLTGVYLAVLMLTPPAILVSTIGFDNAASVLQPPSHNEIPAKDWDAEILSTTEPHDRFELFIQASQYYSTTGDLHKSLNYLKQAESMATSLNDEDMFARVYHAYALYFQGRGKYAKAETYLEQAIDIGMKRSDKNYLQIATHFQALASLKYQQQDMKKYESDLITALLFAKKIETPDQRYIIGNILSQLLDLYYQEQQLDTVKVLLEQTLKDINQGDSAPFTRYIEKFIHKELGWFYTAKGDFNSALDQFKQAMALLGTGKNPSKANFDPMEKTNLFLAMAVAQYKQGNLALAQTGLSTAESVAKANYFDSLRQYIETYYPSDNSSPPKNAVNSTFSTGEPANEASRETERWKIIQQTTEALNPSEITAAQ